MMEKKEIDILLVEDNPDHAELIIRELKSKNGLANSIHHVKDGAEALDYLFHKGNYSNPATAPKPGLILLDLKLPKIDGLEVLKTIKNDPDLKIIPVVMLTTSLQDEDIAQSYSNGINSYINKPVRFEDFIKVIRDIRLYWVLTNVSPDIA